MKAQIETRSRIKDKKVLAAAVLLIAAVGGTYANSFSGPFIFDDMNSIAENPSIRHLWSAQVLTAPPTCLTAVGRPVLNVSLAINYAAGGLNVWGYHAVNLGIHVLAALTLLGLVRRTLLLPSMAERFGHASTALALAVALLWSLHPLQTESVTYVVQRAESLASLLYLLTLYCFLRSATSSHGGAWAAAAVAACALGMASKEIMVSAPLMALLYDRTFVSGSFKEAWRRRWGLYLALACTWAILGSLVFFSAGQGGRPTGLAGGNGVWAYALSQFVYIVHYLRLAFWPSGLALDYGTGRIADPVRIVPCAIVVLLLVAAVAAALVRRPRWAFAGVWFFAILAPTSSIVPMVGQVAAEHRMYLPLAAVVAAAVLGAYAAMQTYLPRPRQTIAAALAGVLVLAAAGALGWASGQRNELYRSDLAIWNDAALQCPGNYRAYNNRGTAYQDRGMYSAAVKDFDKAIELKPDYPEAYYNRGNAFSSQGRYDAAVKDFDKAIELIPGYLAAYQNRGAAHAGMGLYDPALQDYAAAIARKPDWAEAYFSRGTLYLGMGLLDQALADFTKAIELDPGLAGAYNNRGEIYSKKGRYEDALRDYAAVIALSPGDVDAYNNRGNVYNNMGRFDAAIRDYDTAIAMKPRDAAAYGNRAVAHFRMKAYDQAWADVKMIRRLGGVPKPEFLDTLTRASGRRE